MNKKQRNQNRQSFKDIAWAILENVVCPECGEKGRHFIDHEVQLKPFGPVIDGFWICPRLYGADGRRLEGV